MCLFLVLFCISPTGRNYPMYLTVNMFRIKCWDDPNHLISFHNFQRFHFFDIVRTIFRFPAQEDKCEVIIPVQLYAYGQHSMHAIS